jgi:hypothetical protein
LRRSAPYLLFALFALYLVYAYGPEGWQSAAISIAALAIIYTSIKSMFLESYLRKQFAGTGLAGKRYRAKVDEVGIEVVGDEAEWRMKWSYIKARREGKISFCFDGQTVMFIYGKRFLTEAQQENLRSFISPEMRQ